MSKWDITKITYNEGDRISSIIDPTWNARHNFSGVPVSTKHNPCGYWSKGEAGSGQGYIPAPSPPIPIPVVNEWVQVANFPGDMRSDAVAAAVGNKIYMGMGLSDEITYGDWWEYNTANNSWTEKTSLLSSEYEGGGDAKGRHQAVAVTTGGKVYVGLGQAIYNSGVQYQFRDWYEYNPGSDEWVQKANFPGGYVRSAAAAEVDGIIYVGAGVDSDWPIYRSKFYKFVSDNNEWTEISDPGNPRYEARAVGCDGKLYVGGGYNNETTFQRWQVYDPEEDSWSYKSSLPDSFRAFVIGVINDQVYAGIGVNAYGASDDWSMYDPEENEWTTKKSFDGGATAYMASAFIEDRIYVGFKKDGDNVEWWYYH